MVPAAGFEPATFGLQNRCTTTVLSLHTTINTAKNTAKLFSVPFFFVCFRKLYICLPSQTGHCAKPALN